MGGEEGGSLTQEWGGGVMGGEVRKWGVALGWVLPGQVGVWLAGFPGTAAQYQPTADGQSTSPDGHRSQ